MAAQDVSQVIPYAVNSAIVVAILVATCRKPLRKYVYQRHERMKDAIESAAVVYRRAKEKNELAKKSLAELAGAERGIREQIKGEGDFEAKGILESARQESKRLEADADRLSSAELEESSNRIKDELVKLVIGKAEESLKRDLKKDDHRAIVKNAQASIEVGV